MSRFKTQTKLLALTGIVVCAFLCGLLILYWSSEKQTGLLWEDKMAERAAFLSEGLELYQGPLKTFAYDYSFWDDMVSFVSTADSAWGYDNIDISLSTYQADAAWVYHVDGSPVYATATEEATALLRDVGLNEAMRGTLDSTSFNHYFIKTQVGLLEIRTAPIQPSSDNGRVTAARGYWVVGKLWTADVLTNLGRLVQAEIRIIDPEVITSRGAASSRESDKRALEYTYPLPGPDGRPAVELACRAELPLFDILHKTDRNRMIYVTAFALGIMLILTVSLHRWVSRPLKYVMEGLRTGDPATLGRLERAGFEFERVSKLVSEFTAQQADLEAEIIDRKRSEEELRVSETRYRLVAEQTGQMVYDWDCSSGVILWAGAIERTTGFTADEYGHVNIDEWERMIHPDDRRMACDLLAAAAKSRGQYNVEYRLRRKDGSYVYVEDNGMFLATESGEVQRMLGTMKDVTERKQGEEALRDRERLLKSTLESTADGILVVGDNGVVTHWNERFQELWRIPKEIIESRNDERMLRFAIEQLKDPQTFMAKVQALYDSADQSFDTLEFTDGRFFERYSCPLVNNEGDVAGRVWSFRDITQRVMAEEAKGQLQEKLERAQRYESLGLLAGGVAHDLNNMLGPIGGYAELLARELPPESKIAARVNKIIKSSEDAAAVIQDLLTLARRGRYEFCTIDLNHIVARYLESAGFERSRERYPNIQVLMDLSPEGSFIEGSESHLMKVIMNLITNAFEAMPTEGAISILTENARLGRLYSGYGQIAEGDYAVLRIRDTGTGIAEEDIAKIFEPYFSKKQLGHSGSGLGLAVVYGIVKDHGGYYDVFSEVGSGTEFVLYFPLSEAAVHPEESSSSVVTGGNETVLIVDDSVDQRELARDIIAGLGYAVHTAENGHEAVKFLAHNPVDILVLDMIMEPDFDGLDTYREICRTRPRQKAVVVSGFSETDRVREMQRLGSGGYIRKPYRIDDLGKALRKELDRKPV